ncbi:hypothetical protein QAD02_015779 [Eretmocerus hayati]|uniref:Uncharacterized protein n=1 Tax=Eretmocerus hayati TaxID=131215 RepID=A0ACC2PC29_9HYME|nr:hypothetical protein QAD02_015779 [Eretmocerus hayati]
MTTKHFSVDDQLEKASNATITETKIEERVKSIIEKSKNVTGERKLELLLQAITHIDLTSLKGGETFEDIKDLCKKAVNPINIDFKWKKAVRTPAVCVFPASLHDAIKALQDLESRSEVKVACVAGDFPAAELPLKDRLNEIKQVVSNGADEIDIVISRKLAIGHNWKELYEELKQAQELCKGKKLKTILATGDLPTLKEVYIASMVAMLAGSDFIKTSTGKEKVNATLPVGVVMCKAIKDFYNISGRKIGLKPAGGIKTSEDTIEWMTLVSEELGNEWLTDDLFRIGASSVLDDIVKSVHALKS